MVSTRNRATQNQKRLREYQVRLIEGMWRHRSHAVVESPTGSGKTLIIVALTNLFLSKGIFDRVLIAAPQVQIEEGFLHKPRKGMVKGEVHFEDAHILRGGGAKWTINENLIARARDGRGSKAMVAQYLGGSHTHALVCTHQTLSQFNLADLPEDLSGALLVLDEAHHAPADKLSLFVDEFERRGGTLHFYTATPWRRDGGVVVRPGMRVFRRSLAQHMDEGFAPARLSHQLNLLGSASKSVSPTQYSGAAILPDEYTKILRKDLVAQWVLDGRPKTIIRIPPAQDGRSVAPDIKKAFERQTINGRKVRVFDATGLGRDRQSAFIEMLDSEREADIADSEYDIILGIMRVKEGTDWPHCSAVYCVGMPGSLEMVIQLIGRALRKKPDHFPAEHRDIARIVFFVPGSGKMETLSIEHSRHALLTACFLANNEVGQSLLASRALRAGFSRVLPKKEEGEVDDLAYAVSGAGSNKESEALAYITLVTKEGHPESGIVDEAYELATRDGSSLTRIDIAAVFITLLANRNNATGKRVRSRLSDLAEKEGKRFRRGTMPGIGVLELDAARAAIFRQLEKEFREETLDKDVTLETVSKQLHTLTGGKMRELADRLMSTLKPVLTEEQIVKWVIEYRDRQLALEAS